MKAHANWHTEGGERSISALTHICIDTLDHCLPCKYRQEAGGLSTVTDGDFIELSLLSLEASSSSMQHCEAFVILDYLYLTLGHGKTFYYFVYKYFWSILITDLVSLRHVFMFEYHT